MKKYCIVNFLATGLINVVPQKWVKGKRCFYPSSDCDIHDMILKHKKADDNWSLHAIEVIATYDNLSEAEKHLQIPQKKQRLISDNSLTLKETVSMIGEPPLKSYDIAESSLHLGISDVWSRTTNPTILKLGTNSKLDDEYIIGSECINTSNLSFNQIESEADQPYSQSIIAPSYQIEERENTTHLPNEYHNQLTNRRASKHKRNENVQQLNVTTPPVTCSCSIEQNKHFQLAIMKEICVLKGTLRNVIANQQELMTAVTNQSMPNPSYEKPVVPFELPFGTTENVSEADAILRSNTNTRNNLARILAQLGGSSTNDCTKRIMVKLFCNSTAKEYSYYGKKGKIAFNSLMLSEMIFEAVASQRKVSQKEVERCVQDWLRHAKARAMKHVDRKKLLDTSESETD